MEIRLWIILAHFQGYTEICILPLNNQKIKVKMILFLLPSLHNSWTQRDPPHQLHLCSETLLMLVPWPYRCFSLANLSKYKVKFLKACRADVCLRNVTVTWINYFYFFKIFPLKMFFKSFKRSRYCSPLNHNKNKHR